MHGTINVWTQPNWFAIHAKPHQENLAAAQIAKLDLEAFLPLAKQWKSVCGVPRALIQPLFPGYLFARFIPSISFDSVRFGFGVLRVVGCSRFPIPVSPDVIASIQERVRSDGLIELGDDDFQPGDAVRIEQGPFAGFMGKVERAADDGRRVAILLEAIESARLVVEREWLAAAPLD